MRGLKFLAYLEAFYILPCVAPYMGAWIEIILLVPFIVGVDTSHPTWVRGLKLWYDYDYSVEIKVAPYMGAWIEIWNLWILTQKD